METPRGGGDSETISYVKELFELFVFTGDWMQKLPFTSSRPDLFPGAISTTYFSIFLLDEFIEPFKLSDLQAV